MQQVAHPHIKYSCLFFHRPHHRPPPTEGHDALRITPHCTMNSSTVVHRFRGMDGICVKHQPPCMLPSDTREMAARNVSSSHTWLCPMPGICNSSPSALYTPVLYEPAQDSTVYTASHHYGNRTVFTPQVRPVRSQGSIFCVSVKR